MNGVLGMLDLLLLTDLSDEQRDLAATSREAGSELLTLLNDVLDLSKCEAGKLRLERRPVALGPLLEAVSRFVEPLAAKRGLAFELDAAEDLPAHVLTDGSRLRQILLNLLGNAVKFTDTGTVRLAVHGASASGGTGLLTFEVADTGAGIPRDRLAELFAPFHQLDGSTTRDHGGTGLGLAISRELARALGGDITVESAAGAGSTFTLTLPAPPCEAEPDVGAAREDAQASPKSGLPLRVLVVEDNPVNLCVLRAMLNQLGCAHDTATDGEEAVAACAETEYDVVLMDWHMPVMDGLEATRRIRAAEAGSPRRARIVAVTADAMQGSREQCLGAGMDDYLAKPVALEALRDVLQAALAESDAARD
jgi:CheY-like chemotaxis protein